MFFGENPVSDLSLHVLRAPVLCIMGGRLWFLGHVCSSYTCTGSSARRYGIRASQGQEPSKELTARTLLIPCIIALGLTLHIFFSKSVSKTHKHAHVCIQHLYTYINVCLRPRAFNHPLQLLHIDPLHLGYWAWPSPSTSLNRSTSPASLFAVSSTSSFSCSCLIAPVPLANPTPIA